MELNKRYDFKEFLSFANRALEMGVVVSLLYLLLRLGLCYKEYMASISFTSMVHPSPFSRGWHVPQCEGACTAPQRAARSQVVQRGNQRIDALASRCLRLFKAS